MADETQTVDIYWRRNNGQMTDVVFAYVPAEKLLMEGDMATAAFDWHCAAELAKSNYWPACPIQSKHY